MLVLQSRGRACLSERDKPQRGPSGSNAATPQAARVEPTAWWWRPAVLCLLRFAPYELERPGVLSGTSPLLRGVLGRLTPPNRS